MQLAQYIMRSLLLLLLLLLPLCLAICRLLQLCSCHSARVFITQSAPT
jgi:hypothetical protein